MTFEQDDADRAMAELRAAEGLAAAAAKPEGAMSSIARFLTGTKKAELTPEQIHATVISGEARLLIGQVPHPTHKRKAPFFHEKANIPHAQTTGGGFFL